MLCLAVLSEALRLIRFSDWFRVKTKDDSFQPTIDMLLNVSIFAFYGATCPWYSFGHNDVSITTFFVHRLKSHFADLSSQVIPVHRLIFLGLLVLLLRRLPMILLIWKQIDQIEDWRQALFAGFFGPIGVSAIFYLYTSLDFLGSVQVNGQQREDVAKLAEVMTVVVWFIGICSIVVHGLTIPLGKLGFYLPRTLSYAVSSGRPSDGDLPQTSRGRGRVIPPKPEA